MSTHRISRRRTVRRLVIVASIVAVFIAVAGVLHTANTIQRNRLLTSARAEGLAAFEQGDLRQAANRLAIYNARRPGDPEVTLALANARAAMPDASRDDARAAANLARTASTLLPGDIEPILLEITMRRRLGQYTELLDAADRALRIESQSDEAATARVQALTALGRRDEALDAALKFADRVPDNPAAHRLVLVLLTGLDPAIAASRVRDYADKLESEHPNDPRFLVLAAQSYTQVRAIDQAAAVTERLLEPEISVQLDAATLANATQLLDILGRRNDAETLLGQFLERNPESAEIASISIERAYKQGRIAVAAERANAALNLANERTPQLLLWALLSNVEVTPPTDGFEGTIAKGLEALDNRDPAAAARDFEQALRLDPNSRVAMHLRAVALDRLGNPTEAARLRERLLRVAPDYSIARLAHIQSLLDAARPDRAAAFARLGLQIEPNSGGLALAYALATSERAARGDATRAELEQALDIAQALDGASEDATPASPTHARLLLALGRTAQAGAVINRILDAQNQDAATLLPLAADARRSGLPAATDLLRLAQNAATNDPTALLAVATTLHQQGRTDEATTLVNTAADAPGAGPSLRLARAVFLDRIESPEASERLAALFTEAPRDPATLTVILESNAAWSDGQLINAAVTSLQNITADASDAWRFHEARRLLRFEQTEAQAAEAVRLLEPLASSEATPPRVNILLADALLRLGDTNAAISQLGLAADSGLSDPSLLLRLGWMHHARGETEPARRRARAAALIEPIDPALRRERIALLATVGLINEASRDASALEDSGDPAELALAASIAARAGEQDNLARRLDLIEALPELASPALAVAGDLMIKTGQVARAFELVEKHRPATDNAPFARAEAGILLSALQSDRGTNRLLDAFRLSGTGFDAARAAQVLASKGRTDEAVALIESALAQSPDDPTLTTLRDAIRLDNASLSTTGENVDAASRTIAALQRQIENPADQDRLLDDLRWITSTHPTYYPAWAILTDLLRQMGRTAEAAETATSAMQLMPTDQRPARLAVGVMLSVEPLTRALGAAREWQARSRPDTYEADTTAAALLVRLGRIDEASDLLDRWASRIEGDPDVPPVLFRLYAASLITNARADDAARLFTRRITTDDRWAGHQIEIARDLITFHNEPSLARDWLQRSADITTINADTSLRAAQAAVDLADRTGLESDFETAVNASQDAISVADNDSAAQLLLAQAHRFAQRPELAIEICDDLTRSESTNPFAWMILALALVEQDTTPEAALQAAERAIELTTADSVPMLNALGRAQLAAGDASTAEQTFRKAISIDTAAPSPRVGLAETLLAQGQPDNARRIVRDPLLRRDSERHTLLIRRIEQLVAETSRQSLAD